MKNASEGKDIKTFEQDNSKKNNLEKNNKPILTESTKINKTFKKEKIFLSLKIKIIIIILYFLIMIWLETFYRDYLFEKSIPLQEILQQERKYKIVLIIFRIFEFFGGELSIVILYGIVFLTMPLNYSFLALQSVIYSSYLANSLKMLYQSDRPNWVSDKLAYSCSYGYGNPSGHSVTCAGAFLCLYHLIIKFFTFKKRTKIVFLIFYCIFLFLINISRFILAAHSINQIIYGFTLGLGLHYILIYIFEYHKYTSFEYLKHIRNKRVNYLYYFVHIVLLIITILIYLFTELKDVSYFEEKIFNGIRCKKKNLSVKYNGNGFFQSLSIIALIGSQMGINLLFFILKKQNYMINVSIVEWSKSKKIKNYFLRIPIVLLSSIGIILYFLFPNDTSLLLRFTFSSGVPFLLGSFGIHFIGIYLCIKFKIANNEIYKMDVLHEITATA